MPRAVRDGVQLAGRDRARLPLARRVLASRARSAPGRVTAYGAIVVGALGLWFWGWLVARLAGRALRPRQGPGPRDPARGRPGVRVARLGARRLARRARHPNRRRGLRPRARGARAVERSPSGGVGFGVHASGDRRPAGARPTAHGRGPLHAAADPPPAARRPRRASTSPGTCTPRALLRPRSFFAGVHAPNLDREGLAVPGAGLRPDVVAPRRAAHRVVGRLRRAARDELPAAGDDEPRRRDGRARPRVRAAARDRPAHGRSMAPPVRRVAATAAGVLVPSHSTKRDLLEAHPVDDERVHVTPLGVDVAAFAPGAARGGRRGAAQVRRRPALRVVRRRHRAAEEPRRPRAGVRHARARHAARDRRRSGPLGPEGGGPARRRRSPSFPPPAGPASCGPAT